MKKLTPVLVVEAIEPQLPFWVGRLGFARTVEVPHGDALGFVILARGGVEVMLQARASVREDAPPLGDTQAGQAVLFVEVADLAAVERALDGLPLVFPRRRTFYGSEEVCARDPAGNAITFAQFPPAAAP